jgi:hypothetical protein
MVNPKVKRKVNPAVKGRVKAQKPEARSQRLDARSQKLDESATALPRARPAKKLQIHCLAAFPAFPRRPIGLKGA